MGKEAVGANKVLCWWPDALRPPADVDHPPKSRPEPRVSRFSHMVDVHPPDFFALGLSLKTPPRDRRKRRSGRKRPGGGIMASAMGSPPRIPRARPGPGPERVCAA